MAKMYAWSEIRNGGEVDFVDTPSGGKRKVILKRNVVAHGAEVTQKDVGVSKEEWEGFIESGVVRPYPVPEGADDTTSPSQAFLASLMDASGEIDTDKLMELGLSNPPVINPPADETTAPVGT